MENTKINLRDLSPELKKIIMSGDMNEEQLKNLLEGFRKKNEVIHEQEIDVNYRNYLDSKFQDILDKLQSHLNDFNNIPKEILSNDFKTRVENLETQINIDTTTDIVKQISDLKENMQTLQTKLDTMSSADGLEEEISKINACISLLENRDAEFSGTLDEINEALKTKRANNAKIKKDELDDSILRLFDSVDEISEKLTMISQNVDKVNNFIDILSNQPAGRYLFIGAEGNIATKNFSISITVIYDVASLSRYTDNENVANVLLLPEGVVFKKVSEEAIVTPEVRGKYPDLPKRWDVDDSYLQNILNTNCLVVDDRNGDVVAMINGSGGISCFGMKPYQTSSFHLKADEEQTFPRSSALKKNTITVLARHVGDTGGYVPADAVIGVSYTDTSYTLHNYSDEELELIIQE